MADSRTTRQTGRTSQNSRSGGSRTNGNSTGRNRTANKSASGRTSGSRSAGSRSTSNRSTNSRNTNSRNAGNRANSGNRRAQEGRFGADYSDNTMKFILIAVVVVVIAALLIFMIPKEEKEGSGTSLTPQPTNTVTDTLQNITQTPEATPQPTTAPAQTLTPAPTPKPTEALQETLTPKPTATSKPTATPKPTATTAPTATVTPVPTSTPIPISVESAERKVQGVVSGQYTVQLINDHLVVGNREYYQFCGLSAEQTILYPFLLVDKSDGVIYCYDSVDETVFDFTTFPMRSPHITATPTMPPASEGTITAQQAYEVLCSYPKASLKLAREASAYDAVYDNELTTINGENCYRINLSEVDAGGIPRSRGEFFISVNGTKCYYRDSETYEFIRITK